MSVRICPSKRLPAKRIQPVFLHVDVGEFIVLDSVLPVEYTVERKHEKTLSRAVTRGSGTKGRIASDLYERRTREAESRRNKAADLKTGGLARRSGGRGQSGGIKEQQLG